MINEPLKKIWDWVDHIIPEKWKKIIAIIFLAIFVISLILFFPPKYLPKIFACNCNEVSSDEEQIVRAIINVEAEATVKEDMLRIKCIYLKRPIIKDALEGIEWCSVESRYDTLFENNNFLEVENKNLIINLSGRFLWREADVVGNRNLPIIFLKKNKSI